jgi:hypothetical protein
LYEYCQVPPNLQPYEHSFRYLKHYYKKSALNHVGVISFPIFSENVLNNLLIVFYELIEGWGGKDPIGFRPEDTVGNQEYKELVLQMREKTLYTFCNHLDRNNSKDQTH